MFFRGRSVSRRMPRPAFAATVLGLSASSVQAVALDDGERGRWPRWGAAELGTGATAEAGGPLDPKRADHRTPGRSWDIVRADLFAQLSRDGASVREWAGPAGVELRASRNSPVTRNPVTPKGASFRSVSPDLFSLPAAARSMRRGRYSLSTNGDH